MKKLLFILTIFTAGCTTTLSKEISEDVRKCQKLYAEKDYHVINVINAKTGKRTREEIGIISISSRIICWYPR